LLAQDAPHILPIPGAAGQRLVNDHVLRGCESNRISENRDRPGPGDGLSFVGGPGENEVHPQAAFRIQGGEHPGLPDEGSGVFDQGLQLRFLNHAPHPIELLRRSGHREVDVPRQPRLPIKQHGLPADDHIGQALSVQRMRQFIQQGGGHRR
jgi:hypothetical protein